MSKGREDDIRQFYGAGVPDTLRGFLAAAELLPGRGLSLGPTAPEDVAAWGFWLRGPHEALDALERDLEHLGALRGFRVLPVDVAVRA